MQADYRERYRGRKVLVTGGLGFIGSNLCRALVDLGANVVAVDAMIPDYGGNMFNIAGYEPRMHVNLGDVRNQTAILAVDLIESLFGKSTLMRA